MRRLLPAIAAVALPGVALAVPPFEMPWSAAAPRLDAAGAAIVAVDVGQADGRLPAGAPRRASARRRAEERATAALHRFVDDALARASAHPRDAAAIHRAVDDAARVTGVRPLVDGSAVVLVEVPVAALRAAAAVPGLPWSG